MCLVGRVSFVKNRVATAGSDSIPKVKATLQARPTSPAPARAAARAVFENKVDDPEDAEVEPLTLAVWESCESRISPSASPDASIRHFFSSSAAATLPWHPSGRGLSMSLGKSTKRAAALKARGESLCVEVARERVTSNVSRRSWFACFGKARRLTGTLKKEIS